MNEGYGKRLAVGTGANLGANLTIFLCNFLITPFLLAALGDARYSIFVLAQAVVGYFRLATLGIPASLSRALSASLARSDEQDLNRQFSAAFILLSLIGMATLLIALFFSRFGMGWLAIPPEHMPAARWVLIILGAQVAFSMPLLSFQTVYQAAQRFHILSLVHGIGAIVRVTAIYLAFTTGHVGLVVWAALAAGVEIAQNLWLALNVRSVLPALRLRPSGVPGEAMRGLLGVSVWIFLGNLGFLLYYNTDYLLIGWFVDSSQIAHYNLAARWDPMLRIVVGSFTSLLIPVTASLQAGRQMAEVRQLIRRATRYCLLVAIPACLLLAIFARPFLSAWAGPQYGAVAPVMVILLVPLVFTLSQTPSFSAFVGLGRVRVNGLLTLVSAVVNIGLSIYLAAGLGLGLVGIALGTAITYFLRTGLFSPWYVCRVTGQPLTVYLRRVMLPPMLAAIPLVALAFLARATLQPHTLPSIAAVMALITLVYWLLAWRWVLTEEDRRVVLRLLRRDPALPAPTAQDPQGASAQVRVLMLQHNFPPSTTIAAQRAERLTRHLPANGVVPLVVTGGSQAGEALGVREETVGHASVSVARVRGFDPVAWYQRRVSRGMAVSTGSRQTAFAPGGKWKSVLRTLMIPDERRFWIPAWRRGALWLLGTGCDVVYSTSTPYSAHVAALGLAESLDIPWVMEMRDLWADNQYLPQSRNCITRRIQQRLEAQCLRRADRIVVLTVAHANHLKTRHPDLASKIRVVPNMFEPVPATASRVGGDLRIIFTGNIYGGRSLAPVGRAVDAIGADLPGFKRAVLEVAGKSYEGSWEQVLGGAGDNRRVHGLLAPPRVNELMRTAHAGIVNNPSWDVVHIPGKLYEYIGAGLPVFNLSRQPDIPRLCKGVVPCWQLDSGDEEGIAHAIRELAAWWQDHPDGPVPPSADHPLSSHSVAARLADLFWELKS